MAASAAKSAAARVRELRKQIEHHNYRYHVLDDPEVSGRRIRPADARAAGARSSSTPTSSRPIRRRSASARRPSAELQRGRAQRGRCCRSTTPSPTKTSSSSTAACASGSKTSSRSNTRAEPKLDGLAISFRYESGRAGAGRDARRRPARRRRHAQRRARSRRCPRLCAAQPPKLLEVRGEVFMPIAGFQDDEPARAGARRAKRS